MRKKRNNRRVIRAGRIFSFPQFFYAGARVVDNENFDRSGIVMSINDDCTLLISWNDTRDLNVANYDSVSLCATAKIIQPKLKL